MAKSKASSKTFVDDYSEQVDTVSDSEKGDILATVYGFNIRRNSVYIVSDKPDPDAPEGMKDFSKIPFPGNKDVSSMYFDNERNVWDTGFFSQSPCYYGIDPSLSRPEAEKRVKNIMIPYSDYKNSDLNQNNNEFWDNHLVQLYSGKQFHTSDIQQLFDLYCAVQSKALTPEHMVGDATFKRSMYIVESIESAVDVKIKNETTKFDAIAMFGSMLKDYDRDSLISILSWIRAAVPTISKDDNSLKSLFNSYIESNQGNASRFMDEVKLVENNPNHLKILNTNKMLLLLSSRGRVVISNTGVSYKDNHLGINTNEAAYTLCENKMFSDTYISLINDFENLKG